MFSRNHDVAAGVQVGRFAPTPSGFLHLGNVFCSLLAWLFAKSSGGKIVLRIENLDPQRCTRQNADQLARDLEWLGLTWDEGAYISPASERYFQSQRSEIYAQYFAQLQAKELIYPCFCSRAELHTAEAPHLSDGRILYAGTCRHLSAQERAAKAQKRAPAYRLKVEDAPISFCDGHYGQQSYNLMEESGDFIVRRSDGVFAYQLAVTIDDALMGITQVVRGCDLLSSTPMQLYIYRLLGFTPPSFCHIPLLVDSSGRRLSKRDGDLEIASLRKVYGSPKPIIGLLAYLAGQIEKPEPLCVDDLLPIFDATKIPLENIAVPSELIRLK
ncbi:MAG: tRNA glutamyl-Q(34) synthetase GluQRS [Phascolarctobacterium sp.]